MAKLVPFLRSSSTVLAGTRTNTTITAPSRIVNRDVLRIYFMEGGATGTNPTPTPPAGFTAISTLNPALSALGGSGTDDLSSWIWQKTASNESGDYTITHSSTTTIAYMEVIGNVQPLSDFAVTENPVNENGTNYTATGGTTTADNTWITLCSMCWEDGSPWTPPGGTTPTFTEMFDPTTGTMYIASGVMRTPGATGNKTATGNDQTTTGGQVAFLASLVALDAPLGRDIHPGIVALLHEPSSFPNQVKTSKAWW